MKKKKKLKKKPITILIILIIALVLIFTIIIPYLNSPKRKLIGSWTTDGVTIYKFNKNNTGSLRVSLSEYDFTYKIDKKELFIDFENEKSTDSKYTYSFEDGKLILKGENGEFIFTRK